MNHVFVSYSRKDSATVDEIVARLNSDGVAVWIDREAIRAGDLWREAIVKAVDNSYTCMLMLSPNSVASENVRKEVDLADGGGKGLVPLLLAHVEIPAKLRYQLAGIQWIEYYRDPEVKYSELLEILRAREPKRIASEVQSKREVEIVIKGLNVSDFGPDKQEQLLDLIANFTGTVRGEISVSRVAAGSVHIFIDMPADAAYRLKTAALNRDARLIRFGITALRLMGDRHFVLLKEGRIAPLKSGRSGGRWFIGGLTLMIALTLSALIITVGLPLASPFIAAFFATLTPANTLTSTPSYTPTPSETPTFTPSRTPTPTNTFTPSPTRTRIPSKTPSRTPTLTRTNIPTPATETPSSVVLTEIQKKYLALGGPDGFLGNPTGPEASAPDGYGRFRHFQGGSIYWTPDTGAHEVHGAILQKWASLGWERSDLGYPTTDETVTPDGVGRYNHFQFGSIYWTPDTGAHEVHGAIREKWASLGWERSHLGYPTTDESITPDGIGRYNHFQFGSIYWTSNTGAHEVRGVIHAKWAELGWERSWLGYPISDEEPSSCSGWTRQSRFQNGIIVWSAEQGARDYGFCPPIIR